MKKRTLVIPFLLASYVAADVKEDHLIPTHPVHNDYRVEYIRPVMAAVSDTASIVGIYNTDQLST